MKKLIMVQLILFQICINIPSLAQTTFEYSYSSPLDEISRSLMEDSEGNIYFSVENWEYGLIIKLDRDGQFLDSVRIDNPDGTCNLAELIFINDDYFVVLGHWSSGSDNYLWYVKFDYDLQVIDDKKLDSEGWIVYDFKHIINHNGNIVFIAIYDSPDNIYDICMYEITIYGELIKKMFFHKPSGFNQSFSIIENVLNSTYKVFTRMPLTAERLSSTFNIVDTNFNALSFGSFEEAIYTHNTAKWIDDSTYLLTGKRYQLIGNKNEWDAGILKVTINDSIISSRYFAAPDTVEWPGLFKNLDFISTDNVFYGGSYNTYAYPWQVEPSWIMLNILDSDLNLKAQYYYGGDASYTVNAILATSDSGCVMACSRYDYLTQYNEFDVYILKVNKEGLLVSVHEIPSINFEACFIYPNPGNDAFHANSSTENLLLQLFDMTGKLQVEIPIEKGDNLVQVPALPAGIFLYRIIDSKNQLIQAGKWVKRQ
jgi:hypothetical protein